MTTLPVRRDTHLVHLLALCLDLPELILQEAALLLFGGQPQLQLVQPAPLLLLLLRWLLRLLCLPKQRPGVRLSY